MGLFSNLFNRKSNSTYQPETSPIVDVYLDGLYKKLSDDDKLELSHATGASSQQLGKLVSRYPLCPNSLLYLLSKINGTYWQRYGDHEITVLILGSDMSGYPYYLKSVEQILEDSNNHNTITEIYDGYFDDMSELMGEGIDANLKIGKRLCFSDCMNNGGTSQLFIDFNPAPGGTVGQVVRYLHDPDSYEVIARDFDIYLKKLIDGGYAFIHVED